jgi:hypothetical protein
MSRFFVKYTTDPRDDELQEVLFDDAESLTAWLRSCDEKEARLFDVGECKGGSPKRTKRIYDILHSIRSARVKQYLAGKTMY